MVDVARGVTFVCDTDMNWSFGRDIVCIRGDCVG